MDNSALKILFLTNSFFHHENIPGMKIFLTWKYFWHSHISDMKTFLTWKYSWHENIPDMKIILTLSYFHHENIGWWQRKAVERMTLIPDKDKREQSWRCVANPRFCNQGIEHQKTFSQPSGHLYVIIRISVFVISNKATWSFCNQGIERQKTFSQPSGQLYAFFRSPIRPLETSWRMCICHI